MDQSTHEIRRRNWMNIINQCKNRPADITAKQWLADNGISDKSYYYWLRKIRLEAYEQLNVPAVTQSAEVSFAEPPPQAVNPAAIAAPNRIEVACFHFFIMILLCSVFTQLLWFYYNKTVIISKYCFFVLI